MTSSSGFVEHGEAPIDRTLHALRICGAVLVALVLAATIVQPLMLGHDFSWAPLAHSMVWGAILLGLGWRCPAGLAAAGTVLTVAAVVVLTALQATGHGGFGNDDGNIDDMMVAGAVLRLVVVGGLLLGGAAALTVGEIEGLRGAEAYRIRRILVGLLVGAVAGALANWVLMYTTDIARDSGLIYTTVLLLLLSSAVTASVAVSPVALLSMPIVLFLTTRWLLGEEGTGRIDVFSSEEPELLRHALQLGVVVLVAVGSTIPPRPGPPLSGLPPLPR